MWAEIVKFWGVWELKYLIFKQDALRQKPHHPIVFYKLSKGNVALSFKKWLKGQCRELQTGQHDTGWWATMDLNPPGTLFVAHEEGVDLIALCDKNGWISGWGENTGCHLPCPQQGFWPCFLSWRLSSLFLGNLVWTQGWPFFEEKIGLEISWASFQPELSHDPQKDLVPQY